jgi:beta-glucuronidase
MGGQWLFRLDKDDVGLKQRFQRQTSRAGWSPVQVPHAWNVGDDSPESMGGSTGWYRKDFSLPSAASALDWAVRFESVNYRSRIWLNGRPVGTNKGAYIPFEFLLSNLKRRGTNRLVIRVDSRRRPTDFPPSGLTTTGAPTGGWWNYGGILREVYLRRIDRIDWRRVRVTPELRCGTCAAAVKVEAELRNVSGRAVRGRVTGRLGNQRLDLGSVSLGPRSVTKRTTTVRIARPRLWSPDTPNLYRVRLSVTGGGRTLAGYALNTGIRSIKVSGDGHLLLNGKRLNIRGLGLHEDSKEKGFAVGNDLREKLVDEAKQLGATTIRTHYPMHPYTHELADRKGLLIWSEIPVYAVKTRYLVKRTVRELAAKELTKNIETFGNHPSVLLWSIANELSSRPWARAEPIHPARGRPGQAARPVAPRRHRGGGLPVVGLPARVRPARRHRRQRVLRLVPRRERLAVRPPRPVAVPRRRPRLLPEQGADGDGVRRGGQPRGSRRGEGDVGVQRDYVNYNLATFATKPYLSGAMYWALNEFRVRPHWDGGNPRPQSPIHQKGLTKYGTFERKPAWADTQKWFLETDQLGKGPARPPTPAPPARMTGR